jgi:hypothetical protein
MGLQLHARRAAHALTGKARSGIDAARPAYEAGKPLLQGLGISTAIADKALSHYDGIRRALGK